MTRFRSVLLVGAGAMAEQEHLPRIRTFLKPEHLVLVEPSPKRRQELYGKMGNQEKVLEDVNPKEAFDLIIIASPPAVHSSCFHKYLNQSQCFLIEKPLCLSSNETQIIIEACQNHNVSAVVCLPRRKFRHFRLLRDILESHRFGKVQYCRLNEGRVFAWDASYAYFDRSLSGGGVLADIGPHAIDQILQLFPKLELRACELDCEPGGIEANAIVHCRTEDHQPVELCLSRNRYLSNTIEVGLEAASITASLRSEHLILSVPSGNYTLAPENPMDFSGALDLVYQEALLRAETCGLTPQDSLPSISIIEQSYCQSRYICPSWSFSQ